MSSDTWAGVWIGTLFSIPVSIGAALVVPRIQRYLDKRGEASHAKKREQIKEEYEDVLNFALHTDWLIGRMLVAVIQLLFMVLTALVCVWLRPTLDDVLGDIPSPHLSHLVSEHVRIAVAGSMGMAAVIFATVWAVVIFKESSRWALLFSNVRYFKTYVKSIPDDIRDKKYEDAVTYAVRERAMPTEALKRLYFDMKSESESDSQAVTSDPAPDQPS